MTRFDPPFLFTDHTTGGTAYKLALQVVYVDTDDTNGSGTSLDDRLGLKFFTPPASGDPTSANRSGLSDAEDDLRVLVCDINLLSGANLPCTSATSIDVLGTAVWTNAYYNGVFYDSVTGTHSVGNAWLHRNDAYSGSTDPVDANGDAYVWVKGLYHANEDLPTATGLTRQPHTMWPLVRVEAGEPACGMAIHPVFRDDMTTILSAIGSGIETFDGRLEDTTDKGVAGGTPADYGSSSWSSANASSTTVSTAALQNLYDVTTGRSGSDPVGYDQVVWANPSEWLRFDESSSSTQFDSTVAYGRIEWDFLWHGTCTANPAQWCLPDDHRRLDLKRAPDDIGTLIVGAASCPNPPAGQPRCSMACPTAAGATGEVKYDLLLLDQFIDGAWKVGTSGPPDTRFLGPRQRAAFRIMPYSPVISTSGPNYNHGGDWSLPSFVQSCVQQSSSASVTTGSGVVGTGSYATSINWTLGSYDDAAFVTQHELLVKALLGNVSGGVRSASANVQTTLSGFVGYGDDGRVLSIDAGDVGSYGEWHHVDSLRNTATPPVSYANWNLVPFDFAHTANSPSSTTTCPATTGNWWWKSVLGDWAQFAPTLPRIVGKLRYDSSPMLANATCWKDDRSEGMKQAAVSNGYGMRMDSWMNQALECFVSQTAAPNCAASSVNADGYATRIQQAGTTWYDAPWELEMAGPTLGQLTARSQGTRWRYHDLDAAIRWALANHFSLFNLKNSPLLDPAATGVMAYPSSQPSAVFCACQSPVGTSTDCVESQFRRLLVNAGPRVVVSSVSLPKFVHDGADIRMKVRFLNRGNAPIYVPRTVYGRWWDPVAGAWSGAAIVLIDDASDIRPPDHQCFGSWADRTPASSCSTEAQLSYSWKEFFIPSGSSLGVLCNDLGTDLAPDPTVREVGGFITGGMLPRLPTGVTIPRTFHLYIAIQTSAAQSPIPLAMQPRVPTGAASAPSATQWTYAADLEVQP